MILEIVAKRAYGSDEGASDVFTFTVRTDKSGQCHIVAAKKIIRFVNGQLRRFEAETIGVKHDPDLEEDLKTEFSSRRRFRRRE